MVTSIRLNGDKAVIGLEDLILSTPEIACHLHGLTEDQIRDKVLKAVRIGLIALERIENASDLDYVRTEFEKLNGRFKDELELRFGLLEEELDGLLEGVGQHFNPDQENSYLAKLAKTLESYFAKGGSVEKLFDPQQDGSPLAQIKKLQEERTREILDAIVARKAQQETIQKGQSFEDDCEAILTNLVSVTGEQLERTSIQPGSVQGDKTGDFVITAKDRANQRIVLELKAGQSHQSLPKIMAVLDAALINRQAQYAILVAESVESLPNKLGYLCEYSQNKLIIALGSKEQNTFFPEILNIALQLARLRIKASSEGAQSLDTTQLGKMLDELSDLLSNFSQIKTQCTNIEKSSETIRGLVDEIRGAIKDKITTIESLMDDTESSH